MKYKRLIPLIIPLLIWISGQLFLRWPSLFYSALAVDSLMIVLSVKCLAGRGKHDWPLLAIAPVLFFLNFSVYASIIIGSFWFQAIMILIAWFLFVYLKNLYYYFTHEESESIFEDKLDNLLIVSGFLSVFSAATVLFSLPIFITWPTWATILILAAEISLLFLQFMPLKKMRPEKAKVLIMVSVVGLVELAWGLSLLPLKFHLLGLFLATSYYLSLTIIRLHLRDALNRKALKLPLILGALAFILLFLTARWL